MKEIIPMFCILALGCGLKFQPMEPISEGDIHDITNNSKPIEPKFKSIFPVTGNTHDGAIAIGCNCNYTSGVPGQVVRTSICDSGYHKLLLCQGICPGGTPPWCSVCIGAY